MNGLWQDIRYGLRMLAKNPGFTAVAVLTLALGIGAVTSIFSVVYAVLLKPLPYPEPARLMRVWQVDSEGEQSNLSDPNFEDLRDANRSFETLAEYSSWPVTLTGVALPLRVNSAPVSKQFFRALGVEPAIGRSFSEQESQFGGAPAILVSYSFWKNSLGGDTDFSNRRLTLDGTVFSVIGVMPQGFSYPDQADVWVPRERLERLPSRTALNWKVIGRLRPGVQASQARADLSGIAGELKKKYGSDTWMTDVAVVPLQQSLTGNLRPALLLLLGASGILLLAACSNTANLLLAKSTSRQKELAVRVALGASWGRLASQFLTESVLLAAAGGAAGVFIANAGLHALLRFAPGSLPSLADVNLNWAVLAFTFSVSTLTACGLTLAVAFRSAQGDVVETLKQGQQRKTGSARYARTRALLMGSQVAVATMLLIVTALLGKSLVRLMDVHTGYRTNGILTAQVFPPEMHNDADKTRRRHVLDEILQRAREIPGVHEAGIVRSLPLDDDLSNGTFLTVEKQEEMKSFEDFGRIARIPDQTGEAYYQAADDHYFRAMQIPLLRGRMFDDHDGPDAPHAAVISESLARNRWPGQDPIGHHLEFGNMDGDMRLLTIVGVVGDVRGRGLGVDPEPMIYVNVRQRVPDAFSLVLQTSAEPNAIVPSLRELLRTADPDFVPRFRVFQDVVSESLGDREFQLYLLVVFAGAALGMALIGLYGVTSYVVGERTPEIGIRMALGAETQDVMRMILRQGASVVLLGIVAGAGGIAALASLLRGLLYGVAPADPLIFAGVGALLMLVALSACYIPARRAMRVDPLVALRYE
jgi:putative ABC transport system permease protein